jgi:hypothetical protein
MTQFSAHDVSEPRCYTRGMAQRPLMILIAGPYRSGTGDAPAKLAANVAAMEAFALPLFRAGHVPVVGEWFALPLCQLAGSTQVGDAAFQEVFHPIAERLLARCDGVLRVGGASQGADLMVATAEHHGLPVYRRLEDIPGCGAAG